MKKFTNQFLILMVTMIQFGCYESLDENISYFEGIDFKSGDYKILAYGTEGIWIEDFRDFYIEDIETLEKIQSQWIFSKKSEITPCGFGYTLLLVNQTKILKETSINIDCEYMSGWIRFPKEYLIDHKHSFKKITDAKRKEFSKYHMKK